MYGDTTVIRGLARELRERAEELRAQGTGLLGGAESVAWQGWAADAMRRQARAHVAALHRTADAHDDAAAALERHAAEVDRLTRLIAEIERRADQLVAAARDRVAGATGTLVEGLRQVLPDPADELLVRFVAPPPDHRDWLQVDLPGLRR